MKKLTIGIDKGGLVTFENLQEFEQIELMGTLYCALSTAEVLYKTKLITAIDIVMKKTPKGKWKR